MKGDENSSPFFIASFIVSFIVLHRKSCNDFICSQLRQNTNKIRSFQTYKQRNEYEKIRRLPT